MRDTDAVQAYGATQSGFGGTYIDGDRLVVLFTADTEHHERALRAELDHPESLDVRRTSRTIVEVHAAATRVTNLLLRQDTATDVTSVGIAVHEGEFAVEVGLDPYSDERATQVCAETHPDPVVVRPCPRPRPL